MKLPSLAENFIGSTRPLREPDRNGIQSEDGPLNEESLETHAEPPQSRSGTMKKQKQTNKHKQLGCWTPCMMFNHTHHFYSSLLIRLRLLYSYFRFPSRSTSDTTSSLNSTSRSAMSSRPGGKTNALSRPWPCFRPSRGGNCPVSARPEHGWDGVLVPREVEVNKELVWDLHQDIPKSQIRRIRTRRLHDHDLARSKHVSRAFETAPDFG